MQEHLTRELFRAIHQGWREPGDLAAIAMAHLFELCPRCRGTFEGWREELGDSAAIDGSGDYDAVIDRIHGSAEVEDYGEASGDHRRDAMRTRAEELLALPLEEQAAWIRSETAEHSGSVLAEALIEESRRRTPGHPHDGYTLANLARLVLHHSPVSRETTALYARALAYLANATRVIGDLPRAGQVLGDARYFLASQGGGSRLVRAELDRLEGSLRIAQERAGEALPLFLRALMSYRLEGASSDPAAILIHLALAHQRLHDPRRALELLRHAQKELEAHPDPRLAVLRSDNSAVYLVELGECEHAREVLLVTRTAAEELGDPLHLLRRSWNEATIAWKMQELESAEHLYLAVCEGFSKRNLPNGEALVSLDLARLYAQEHRLPEALELVELALPVFEEVGLPAKVAEARALRERASRR